jgi:anti-sigma B factor antagonist
MPKRQLNIDTAKTDGVSIITLSGALDASNVTYFEDALEKACAEDQPVVLLECSDLTYVNSTSFGLFFKYHRLCGKHKGAFAMCGLRGKILNIVKLLGLDSFLVLYPDRQSALAQLRKKG